MTNAPMTTANRNGSARFLACTSKRPQPGLSTTKYKTSANAAAMGKKPRAVNFETTARPVVEPNNKPCFQPGSSTHSSREKNAAVRHPVSAISVVATPACASTGGNIVNNAVAMDATT